MRSSYSKKNAITAIVSNLIKIIIGFFAQKVFIAMLGIEYLGLNGLFTNIISLLAISELGIGTAIIYNLYEPIARNDVNKIKQLLSFYKKAYKIISFLIFVVGVLLIPILPMFVKSITIKGIGFYYLLFLIDAVFSYLIAYKSSMINASQLNFVINIIHMIYLILMNILQIIFLYLTKNYSIYLIIKIICRLIENYFIGYFYKREFSHFELGEEIPLDEDTKNDIIIKVKALLLHQLSIFFVTGTDNIIISKFLGLAISGLYSNYQMIINSVQSLFSQMFNSLISGVGNLLTEKDTNKIYTVYTRMLFANAWITTFCSICIYFMIEPFIKIWLGNEFILDKQVLFVLILVFFFNGMRNAPSSFKSAAGICVEDRFIPIIESCLNIVFSLLLVNMMGLVGVFIGTFISSMILHLYSYPLFVYKKLFHKKPIEYVIQLFKYFLNFIIIFILVNMIISLISFDSSFMQLIVNGLICVFVPNVFNYVIYHKSDNFKYFLLYLKIKK